jgi:hypothetical protein
MQVPIGVWTQRTVLSAKWLEANAPADTMITVYPAGSVPYYAPQHRFLDVLGKNDRHIGHLPTYASLAIGHNRFDFDYVYNVRKPDIAFPDRGCGDFEAPRYMREAERTQLRNHEAIRSPAWDFDRTHPTFMEMYSRNAVHFLDASPELLGCFFVREGSNVPLFWSRDGRYPRVSSFRYDFGSPKLVGPAAMAGRWHVTRANAEDPGHALSAGDADGEGILDVWFDTTKPLVVNGCLGESRGSDASLVEPGDQPLVVNETDEVSPETAVAIASCAGSHVRWRIPREALEKRTTGTRLRFPAGLSVIWLEGASE